MSLSWRSILDLAYQTTFGWQAEDDIDGLDPYAVWADGTAFKGYPRVSPHIPLPPMVESYPFLVEIEFEEVQPAVAGAAITLVPLLEILQRLGLVAGVNLGAGLHGRRYTGTVLIPATRVRAFKSSQVIEHKGKRYRLSIRAILSLPRMPQVDPRVSLVTPALSGLTIAVIDDGCPFAHEHFRVDPTVKPNWRSRVRYLWDQGNEPAGTHWVSPPKLGYGRELNGAAIDRLIGNHTSRLPPHEVDDEACYAEAGYEAVRPRSTHGSVVTDIAAGHPNPLGPRGAPVDAAGAASIIFVQLPRTTVEDVSGGALHGFILDALRYIDDRTTVAGVQQPVAINISFGASAGPHDGSSVIDVAIDDFLAGRKDCGVVIAAGNSYATKTHAHIPIAPAGHVEALRWSVRPDDATDSFLEVWLPERDPAGRVPVVSARLLPPGADPTTVPWVDPGRARFGVARQQGDPLCAVVNARSVANGKNGRMILVAVGPTVFREGNRDLAPSGTWTVEVRNDGADAIEAHAWIQRDDPNFGGKGKQSTFEDETLQHLEQENTLADLCHGQHAIVVGGCLDSDGQGVAPYSGSGPGRLGLARNGPDLIAGSDESRVLEGLRAAGTRSGDTVRMSGTSVATAVVTRRLANTVLCAAGPPCNPYGQSSHAVKTALQPDAARVPAQEAEARVGRGRVKSRR